MRLTGGTLVFHFLYVYSHGTLSIAAVPPFPGLRCFKQGHNFQQWTGNNSKAPMKVNPSTLCSCIHSFIVCTRSGSQQLKVLSPGMLSSVSPLISIFAILQGEVFSPTQLWIALMMRSNGSTISGKFFNTLASGIPLQLASPFQDNIQ